MIRVGVLGCAAIARRSLLPAFARHANFSTVAVASRVPENVSGLGDEYGCRVCDYESLIASDDVDLVYCPLPTGLHYGWVKRALEAGKHVLCEKSLACSPAEVRDLVDTARQHGRFLMESFQFRFHEQNLFVKECIDSRRIGEIRRVSVCFGIPPFPEGAKNIRYSKELGGGALLDNGAYTTKCATYLLGKKNVRVLAAMAGGFTPELGDVDLTGSIMMSVGSVPIQTSYGFDHFYQNGYVIWGTQGCITTTRAFTAREDFEAPVVIETVEGREVRTFRDDHFARMLDYVAKCIVGQEFEGEYEECLVQADLIADVRKAASL